MTCVHEFIHISPDMLGEMSPWHLSHMSHVSRSYDIWVMSRARQQTTQPHSTHTQTHTHTHTRTHTHTHTLSPTHYSRTQGHVITHTHTHNHTHTHTLSLSHTLQQNTGPRHRHHYLSPQARSWAKSTRTQCREYSSKISPTPLPRRLQQHDDAKASLPRLLCH